MASWRRRARPRRRTREAGLTLLEALIALAIGALLIVGVMTLVKRFHTDQAALDSRSAADTQATLLMERVGKLFRSRAATRDDGGFRIASCSAPEPSAPCLDVLRVRHAGKSDETVEKLRVKTACVALTDAQAQALKSMKLPKATLAKALESLCGVSCPEGQRPLATIRHWTDEKSAAQSGKDQHVPPAETRLWAGEAVASAFCPAAGKAGEVRLKIAVAYLKDEREWTVKLARRELVLPTSEDKSKIEWLP